MTRLLTLILLLVSGLVLADLDGSNHQITLIPNSPTEGMGMIVELSWIRNGCFSQIDHELTQVSYPTASNEPIKMYVFSRHTGCVSPWFPTEVSTRFNLQGLEEGVYTLQFFDLFSGFTSLPVIPPDPIPQPGDLTDLLVETQFGVLPAPNPVNILSPLSVITLLLLFMCITYISTKRVEWKQS